MSNVKPDKTHAQHRKARALAEKRLLGKRLNARSATWLRTHLSQCPECSQWYDVFVRRLRVAAGVEESRMLGIEANLLMDETLDRILPQEQKPSWMRTALSRLLNRATDHFSVESQDRARNLGQMDSLAEPSPTEVGGRKPRPVVINYFRWIAGIAAACVLIALAWIPLKMLIAPFYSNLPERSMLSRGDEEFPPDVGLGVSGVNWDGTEYEVMESDGACIQDALKFYLTVRKPGFDYYFLFGLQDESGPIWYIPSPEERVSLPLPAGPRIAVSVPWEIEPGLGGHSPAPLVVVCLFSPRPLFMLEVQAAVAAEIGELESPDFAQIVASRLEEMTGVKVLAAEAVVNLLDCGGER